MRFQHTVGRSISIMGTGLHSGQPSILTLSPAPVDSGIIFVRKGKNHNEACQASIRNLRPMDLCTTIGSNGFQVQTIEHILSALWGLEIDNVNIELNSEEVPAMDGSAAPFVKLIQAAGRVPQERQRTYLKILKPLHVGQYNRSLSILPSPIAKVTYSIDYDHSLIQQQTYEYDGTVSEFMVNIATARTFAFSAEVESLWARGLGKGGSLENTVVFSDTGVLNQGGLRFPNECVRHKILDLIGDLALLGVPIIGHIIANRSGHHLHTELVRTILDNPEAWTLLDTSDKLPFVMARHSINGAQPAHSFPLTTSSIL